MRLAALLLLLLVHTGAEGKTRVVILGDSLTEGYGVARERAFPALVEKSLTTAGKDVEIVNGGSSGSTSASAPSRMRWYLKSKPQIVVLALGANDFLRGFSLAGTEKNLGEAIELAKKEGVKVLLAGIKVPTNYGKKYGNDLEKIYPSLSKQHKIPLIPFLLEGVGGVPSNNLSDGIHPNEKGHEIIAKLVEKYLAPLL